MHEIITTPRLVLRPARLDDAPAVFERYAADPEVTRFLQWRPQPNVEAVRGFLQRCEVAVRVVAMTEYRELNPAVWDERGPANAARPLSETAHFS